MHAKIIACSTMADEIKMVLPADIELELLPYALHNTPQKLQAELQQRIDADVEHDTLLFGYGLCSYGVANLSSERHTLVIPKVHDCISLLLGAREVYDREFEQFPGTYFLSKGWIDQGAEPYGDYLRYVEKYGKENARWLIDSQYANYQRVVFIDTGVEKMESCRVYSQRVAGFIKVPHGELKGSLLLLEKMFRGEWDEEFVVTPPGRMVLQNQFL